MIRLRANPVVRPAIALLASSAGSSCFAPASPNLVLVTTDQPSSVSWRAVRLDDRVQRRCVSTPALAMPRATGRSSASGRTSTGDHCIPAQNILEYVARFVLPVDGDRRGLQAGAYRLTVTATNAYGTRRAKTVALTVLR